MISAPALHLGLMHSSDVVRRLIQEKIRIEMFHIAANSTVAEVNAAVTNHLNASNFAMVVTSPPQAFAMIVATILVAIWLMGVPNALAIATALIGQA
eukprot:4002766-Pyramimonas_sp.AAC.1